VASPDEGLGTRFDAAERSPGLALWQVTNRWQAAMRGALEPHGLTHVQYVLLASLVWLQQHDPDALTTQAQLAEFAATDVMMTSQVVRTLQAKGLLSREAHPQDGRARALRPTPAGVRVARDATADVEDADASFFAPLDDGAAFLSELARLRGGRTR
jgi:DNA-binding MarR family transcriptional regulator